MANRMVGCDTAQTESLALVSTSTRIEPLQHLSAHTGPTDAVSAGSTPKQGSTQSLFRSVFSRPILPIYLRTEVFLC
jgi:hypothetical protein